MGVPELESNCNALSNLFQGLINDMRDSVPAFEELVNRTTKLHSTLRSSIVAIAAFLEAFQKVADAATNSKGATKEIGKSLTRLCLRHRSIESKMKSYTSSLMEELAAPLQEKLEQWKNSTVQIDKEHAKDNKKVRGDIKRASSDTIRLQKKSRKGKGDAKEKLEHAMHGVTERYKFLEEVEKSYVRRALIEERKHFCDFVCCLRPVVDSEMSMVNEIAHLQEIVDHLSGLVADPDTLPATSEQVINDIKGTDYAFKTKTPPDSPTSDRHSLSSSMNSLMSAPESDGASQRSCSPSSRLQVMKQRSHGSLEEEKSDSLSVYSSVSQGSSNEYDSGSVHSVPTAVQSQLRQQQPLERAHTISSTRSISRPPVSSDTYDAPQKSSEVGSMGPPPRPIRMSSYEGSKSSTSSQAPKRSSTISNNRNSMPPRTRAKPKPVATPSVPFMDTEPIYMNTQELAAKIAARKRLEEESEKSSQLTAEPAVAPPVAAVTASSTNKKPPTTKDEEIRAQNDALADAIAELEASTAALNDCFDEPNNRQSVVSSSGYGTTTSNSSASEDVQLITHETVDNYHTNSINMQNVSATNRISEEVSINPAQQSTCNQLEHAAPSTQSHSSVPGISAQQHANELKRESEGVEVSNWAGKAIMRKSSGQAKPPPPARRSSSVSSSINGVIEKGQGQRASKPPVISPKPKLSTSNEGHTNSRTCSSSTNSVASEMFPSPPPLHQDDEDPYAVPMPCHPVEISLLPPPPAEFGITDNNYATDNALLFNISDLPPPIPDSPAPAYLTSQVSPGIQRSPGPQRSQATGVPQVSKQQDTAPSTTSSNPPPWGQTNRSPTKSNSKGEAPPPTLAKKGKKLNSNFIAQLNSTLGGGEKANSPVASAATHPTNKAALEQLKTGRSTESPPRGHLLSQIHGGVQLKKTTNIKDRSAPSI